MHFSLLVCQTQTLPVQDGARKNSVKHSAVQARARREEAATDVPSHAAKKTLCNSYFPVSYDLLKKRGAGGEEEVLAGGKGGKFAAPIEKKKKNCITKYFLWKLLPDKYLQGQSGSAFPPT